MPRRTACTAANAVHLALVLPLALALVGCADCGGGGGDAGPDAGTSADGGDEGQCEFLGGECSEDADCCNDLVCLDDGMCGNAPSCEENDTFAGTATSPADLGGLGDNTPIACQGFPFLDVFSVEAEAGEILLLSLDTEGLPPFTEVAQGQADIDLYLLSGPPTGVAEGLVEGPVVAAGATVSSTEQVIFEVTEAGTYYVAVTLYAGPDTAYSLSFSRATACALDADCGVDEFCQVAVEGDFGVVLQTCATWTAPGCGVGDDEAGGDVHSDTDAVDLSGAMPGLACAGDIDVFTFEKALEERALLSLTSESLADEDVLVASVVDQAGALLDVFVLEAGVGSVDYSLGVGTPAGTYYVYLEQFGPGTGEAAYTLALDLQAACRADDDCADGRTCGDEVFGGGPIQVCVVADDPCADDDSDNSRTAATALAPDADVTAELCMGGRDIYEIVLDQPATDVVLSIDWDGNEDLDLYVYAEDGTLLGAGWYGTGGEVWEGVALPAQRLYAWVSAFACDFDADGNPIPCSDLHGYTIAVEKNAATVCDEDADCFVGGVSANDPANTLACRSITVGGGDVDAGPGDDGDAGPDDDTDGGALEGDAGETDAGESDAGESDAGETPVDGGADEGDAGSGGTTTVQACVRPVAAALLTQGGGEACYDGYDCSTIFCVDGYCTSDCATEADCAATLGEGNGYCMELADPPFCLKTCTADADCDRVFGADQGLVCSEGECVLP